MTVRHRQIRNRKKIILNGKVNSNVEKVNPKQSSTQKTSLSFNYIKYK